MSANAELGDQPYRADSRGKPLTAHVKPEIRKQRFALVRGAGRSVAQAILLAARCN